MLCHFISLRSLCIGRKLGCQTTDWSQLLHVVTTHGIDAMEPPTKSPLFRILRVSDKMICFYTLGLCDDTVDTIYWIWVLDEIGKIQEHSLPSQISIHLCKPSHLKMGSTLKNNHPKLAVEDLFKTCTIAFITILTHLNRIGHETADSFSLRHHCPLQGHTQADAEEAAVPSVFCRRIIQWSKI